MEWRALTDDLPKGEVLVWLGNRAAVAVVVPADDSSPESIFMDARTCDLLPWPSHWMPIAPPAW
ncbi:MAG: hypothetical protein AVDCRST_MAG93-1227 [uncultured Chloroflexia bacterium]|uniref:Uncharacterized protein n=1 Tax=uncultured Chloroflexia bacterium TaxID=1672391 RepID=A0A6J4I1F6_9CHLR|nr:MAG: hypothetical protein AVDCRST_MAG93-1227 [uncultured Chloroflexia bacterium]